MSKHTFDKYKDEYIKLYYSCKILDSKISIVDDIIDKITSNKSKYITVSEKTKVPWYVIAVLHNMESSLNFKCHLHNGDPLTAKTKQVPAGRPISGSPPYTWEESAIDALNMKLPYNNWSIAGICYFCEKYNGFGYRNKNTNSPYLWSFSNNYKGGKYVADGIWDPIAMSKQCGAITILKQMEHRKIISIENDNLAPIINTTNNSLPPTSSSNKSTLNDKSIDIDSQPFIPNPKNITGPTTFSDLISNIFSMFKL